MAAAADDLALAFFPNPGLHLHTMEESAEIWQISFLPQVFWHLEGTVTNSVTRGFQTKSANFIFFNGNTIILTVFKMFHKTVSGHSKCIWRRAKSFPQNGEKYQVKNIILRPTWSADLRPRPRARSPGWTRRWLRQCGCRSPPYA